MLAQNLLQGLGQGPSGGYDLSTNSPILANYLMGTDNHNLSISLFIWLEIIQWGLILRTYLNPCIKLGTKKSGNLWRL